MKFARNITQLTILGAVSGIFASGFLLSAIATSQTKAGIIQLAQALSPEEVNLRAKQIIVRIDGGSVGSGSIVEHVDDSYTVLTNWHVMKNESGYTVQTIDGRKHEVIPASIKQLPGLDLALVKFTSQQNYQTAELGDSSSVSEGQIIYFAGYPGELRREDNRYYRFFTANMVGILPKATENGYSLIYSGEAFPGMSGGPVFNREGLLIGVHGEANVHALSGGTSNYAVPIASYQQAIAELNTAPEPTASTPPPANTTEAPEPTPEVAEQPSTTPPVETPEPEDNAQNSPEKNLDAENISSVPTFAPESETEASKPEPQPKPEVETEKVEETEETEETATVQPEAKKPEPEPEPEAEPEPVELEEITVPTVTRKIALVSPKTGIDYTKLRNLLKEGKWSEADIHTYRLVEQIVKSAKNNKKNTFIELKTIAEYSCPDVRTVDYLWKKYSDDQFGFSPQQKVWQNVNQEGDFSTQTWRRFATQVGWKKGEVSSGSGYLLYDQLDFEPTAAPEGHLPWWFALPDEEQKVIKYLFARCNLNPTLAELEAEAKKNAGNTAQKPGNNGNRQGNNRNNDQSNPNKKPEAANN